MSEFPDPDQLTPLVRLARAASKPSTSSELEHGLVALRARLAGGRSRRRPWRVPALIFTGILLCGAVVAVTESRLRDQSQAPQEPVSVARIVGGQILEGGYLSEVGGNGVRLDFNEGSRFELTPGTRGRLGPVLAEGARLVLDHGTASCRITRNPARRWSVEAGPFVVTVRGTDFTVVWEPTSEEFEVRLRQGHVAVSGPVVGAELVLHPGQNLAVSLEKRESVISERNPEQAAAPRPSTSVLPSASGATSAATLPQVGSAPSALLPVASASKPVRRWREALQKGEWDLILAEAEREGVDTGLKTLSSDELLALADAARYRRRPDVARAALLAERERFPNSSRALDATFLLGRVEELRANRKLEALAWYDEYLGRAPHGTYAAEALGRKMILVEQTEGRDSARRIASEYLSRFSSGSYAEVARTLQSR